MAEPASRAAMLAADACWPGWGRSATRSAANGPVGAEQALHAHGRGHVRRPQQPGQVGAGQHEHAEHAVGAVDQRQPLLGLEGQVEGGGDVGEGRQVAAAAERAELGDLGQPPVVEQVAAARPPARAGRP